jgi:WD40 repeat protein
MEVRIKYEIASRSTISSISFNSVYNILAVTADGNDTTNFFTVDSSTLKLVPKFNGESKPPASGCVSWSPNGHYIIVANLKVEIWKFDGNRLTPIRIVNEGFV